MYRLIIAFLFLVISGCGQDSSESKAVRLDEKTKVGQDENGPSYKRFSVEQEQEYLQLGSREYIKGLRHAINSWKAGDLTAGNLDSLAYLSAKFSDGMMSGLDSFDKSYFSGRFVVLSVDDGSLGSKMVHIMFNSGRDKIFTAVMSNKNESYYLSEFYERNIPADDIKSVVDQFAYYLDNELFSF